MRAINHALTGAVIGLAWGNPWLAPPAALLSHFAVDAIPHHDFAQPEHGSRRYMLLLVGDGVACLGLVSILAAWQPEHWLLACVCAFLATSPDLMWTNVFLRARRGQRPRQKNRLMRFHSRVQWFEKPIGALMEMVWFADMCWLLYFVGR